MGSRKYYTEFKLRLSDESPPELFCGIIELSMPVSCDDHETIVHIIANNFGGDAEVTAEDVELLMFSSFN